MNKSNRLLSSRSEKLGSLGTEILSSPTQRMPARAASISRSSGFSPPLLMTFRNSFFYKNMLFLDDLKKGVFFYVQHLKPPV